ncbi:hypothetical protein JTB14_022090 [Gonioctena quinquepunctata]|nr:hypothetical protein JTB14_022090 [Gonioctena quinquepunctata]
MGSKKRLTVQDVADMFESEQFWADFENDGIERVYIEPPDDKEESDEDSGDESGGLLSATGIVCRNGFTKREAIWF